MTSIHNATLMILPLPLFLMISCILSACKNAEAVTGLLKCLNPPVLLDILITWSLYLVTPCRSLYLVTPCRWSLCDVRSHLDWYEAVSVHHSFNWLIETFNSDTQCSISDEQVLNIYKTQSFKTWTKKVGINHWTIDQMLFMTGSCFSILMFR